VSVADPLIGQAEALAQSSDWGRAADLLAGSKGSLSVLEKRAYYLSRAGRIDDALAILAEMLTEYPDDFKPYFLTGYQHLKKGDHRQAALWLEQAASRNPTHIPTLDRLAFSLSKAGDHAGAARYATRVIKEWYCLEEPQRQLEVRRYVTACCLLGKRYLRSDPQSAVEYYEAAVQNDLTNPWPLYGLGCALGAVGRHVDALAALNRASELKPGDVWIELERAAALIRHGQRESGLGGLILLKPRLNAWEAERGARVAMLAADAALALELIDVAVRSRAVRKHPRVARLRGEAQKRAQESGVTPAAVIDELHTGRIDVLQPDRGFGFVVDDRDGARRHFRVRGRVRLTVGDRVKFRPRRGEKGPAAEELTPIYAQRHSAG